jgi:hypothetical protein
MATRNVGVAAFAEKKRRKIDTLHRIDPSLHYWLVDRIRWIQVAPTNNIPIERCSPGRQAAVAVCHGPLARVPKSGVGGLSLTLHQLLLLV